MALLNNSNLTNLKTHIGNILNNDDYQNTQFNDDMIDSLVRQGLNEMAKYADPSGSFVLKRISLPVTSLQATMPADYLYHDESVSLLCTKDGETETINISHDEHDFFNTTSSLNDLNYYQVLGNTIDVNFATITAINFKYTAIPTMLTAGVNQTDFREDLYDHLAYYVIGKYFLTEVAVEDQGEKSLHYFLSFYKEIGAVNYKELAENQVN